MGKSEITIADAERVRLAAPKLLEICETMLADIDMSPRAKFERFIVSKLRLVVEEATGKPHPASQYGRITI